MSSQPPASVQVPAFTPPAFSQLDFTATPERCDIASRWFAAAALTLRDHDYDAGAPGGYTVEYLQSITQNMSPQLSITQLIVWYIDVLATDNSSSTNQTVKAFVLLPNHCDTAICDKLEWEGDSDISGVGMMLSYYIAAVFTTIYFAILAATNLERVRRNRSLSDKLERYFVGFQESSPTFLDAALIFAVAMSVAGVTRYASFLKHAENYQSVYGLIGSVYMSAFAVLPAIVLQCVSSSQRRHWLRIMLWFLILVFNITLSVLYQRQFALLHLDIHGVDIPNVEIALGSDPTRVYSQATETMWLKLCDPEWLRFSLMRVLIAGRVVLCLNIPWLIYGALASFMPTSWRLKTDPSSKGWQMRRRCGRGLRLLNGLVCLIMMWVMLAFFHVYRDAVSAVAGDSDKDSDWTFGQVLALAEWAPVVVDLFLIYYWGPQSGLSARMSKRYEVIRTPAKDDRGRDRKSSSSLLPTTEHARGPSRQVHQPQRAEHDGPAPRVYPGT